MKHVPLFTMPSRERDSKAILPWSSRSPRSKEELLAVRTTEQQIIDEQAKFAPKAVVTGSVAGGIAAYQLHGAISGMALFQMLGASSLLAMSAIQLALLASGGILSLGSLGIVIWRAGRMRTEDKRVVRGWHDLDNLEQLQAKKSDANPKNDLDDDLELFS